MTLTLKKRLINVGVLSAVFIVAVIIFSYVTNKGNDNMTADMGAATFPQISFSYGDYKINTLTGYAKRMDVSSMHNTITPVADQSLDVNIEAYGNKFTGASYKVYTLDGTSELESKKIKKAGKNFSLDLSGDKVLDEERILEVRLNRNGADPVYFYTRIVSDEDANVAQCLNYISDYHENALAKAENAGVGAALEQDDEDANSTFSHVTIHSSYDQVTWGNLAPQVTGGERWKITEANSSYTSVLLEYDVSCTGEENETDMYTVREFFRVRKNNGQMYLLNYDRTMEQIFDGSKNVLSEKGILLGITDPDVPYVVSSDGKIVAFVQADELWNYDKEQDQLSLLFSFRDAENADVRNKVSDHKIQILNMDKKGNTTFSVSGYMNRGEHEGYVGVAVYYYNIETNSIEEKAFVSSNKSAAIAGSELDTLKYYNTKTNKLYMLADGALHEISIKKDYDEVLLDGLKDGQYVVSDNGKWLAYQTGDDVTSSTEVTVMNLSDGSEYQVKSADDECMIPLGFVGNDFVSGLAKLDDIGKTISGEQAVAMYQIEIRSDADKVIKTYSSDGYYILSTEIDDGMITLNRVQKNGDTYTSAAADYISSNQEKKESNIMLESYVTDLKETQMRLTYADGIKDKSAKVLKPKQVVQDDPALPSFGKEVKENGYYVYGTGQLQGIYKTAGEAIRKADSVSGVVIDAKGQYVWERGNRYLVYDLSTSQASAVSELQNALASGTSVLEAAGNMSDQKVLELTGCTVEEMLYLINKDTPVIGVRNGASAIILTGYDESHVTYVDSENGESKTVTQEEMDQIMQSSGNAYVGYLKKAEE